MSELKCFTIKGGPFELGLGFGKLAKPVFDAYMAQSAGDGDPYLKDKCMLVEVRPTGKPGFISFYYPGSLPSHTFAASYAGIAQAINKLRIVRSAPGVPRMILARAVLDADALDAAVAMLRDHRRAGGFHHTSARWAMRGC